MGDRETAAHLVDGRRMRGRHAPILVEDVPNTRWSVDIARDPLPTERRMCIFAVVDDVPKVCLGSRNLDLWRASGARTRKGLPGAASPASSPRIAMGGHGPLAQRVETDWHVIAPGNPMQNGICHASGARVRHERLNETRVTSLNHIRVARASVRR